MTTLIGPVQRLTDLARTTGWRAALNRAYQRARVELTLAAREAWLKVSAAHLPSAATVLAHTTPHWDRLSELLDHLRTKSSPAYLFSAAERERLIARWQAAYPASVQATLAQAAAIERRQFEMLGTRYDFSAIDEVDWNWDATAGRRWPPHTRERLDRWLWADQVYGDYRPLWELNRHQYFVTLGQAYWLTGDERYADTCAAHLLGWLRANPYPLGVQWYSSLEIGLRLIAWSLAFHYFRTSDRFCQRAGDAFIRSVYQQAQYLRGHLTLDWAGRNNHIIGEAAALTYVGALFDEFAAAREWRVTGYRILQDEVARQTYPDGVNREQATAYHNFVLEAVLLILTIVRRGALEPAPRLAAQAEAMLDYAAQVLNPIGDLPSLGDGDDGHVISLSLQPSVRDTLALGAALFERADFKFAARGLSEGAFWLLGEDGRQAFEALPAQPPARLTAHFPHAGQFVSRTGWTQRSDYALLRCGEFGLGGEGYCAHAHCDLLSPILWIAGRPVLIDAGTYAYRGEWRDRLRLTAAHSTLQIDGRDQAVPLAAFAWQRVPVAHGLTVKAQGAIGWVMDADSSVFEREVVLVEPGTWRVIDRVTGSGTHTLAWMFQFAPGLIGLKRDRATIRLSDQRDPARAIELAVPEVAVELVDGWCAPRYGQLQRHQALHAQWSGALSAAGVSFCWQFRGIT